MTANFLPLGGIAPSWQRMANMSAITESLTTRTLNNTVLREGWIVGKHYPEDEGYANFHSVVYDVLVAQFDVDGGLTWDLIRNAQAQGFLGNSDEFDHTSVRAPVSWQGTLPTIELARTSSRVLISFLDGRTNQGVITGFLENPFAPKESKNDGYHSLRVFNGVRTETNKDGEYSITRTGIIVKDDNTLAKAEDVKETSGAFIKLDKDGNVVIDNSHGETVVVNTKTKEITVTARAKTENITEKDWTVNVKGNVNIMASGNASFNASGKTFLGSTKAKENVVLGKQLQTALKQVVNMIENFTTTPCIPGHPAMASPIVKIQTQNWKTLYGSPSSPFLSKKKFTE